ncbi:hypothetical protein GCM10020331_084470 [Ectobacillus funiculus]
MFKKDLDSKRFSLGLSMIKYANKAISNLDIKTNSPTSLRGVAEGDE